MRKMTTTLSQRLANVPIQCNEFTAIAIKTTFYE